MGLNSVTHSHTRTHKLHLPPLEHQLAALAVPLSTPRAQRHALT